MFIEAVGAKSNRSKPRIIARHQGEWELHNGSATAAFRLDARRRVICGNYDCYIYLSELDMQRLVRGFLAQMPPVDAVRFALECERGGCNDA